MDNKKKKSFIRTEAVIPALIIVGLIVLYFAVFFDSHLKWGLEWGGTYGNGAEVNIARVKTSFIRGTLGIDGIQLTDPAKPERNRLEIGQVRFNLNWDALLRAKVVADDAGIESIQINSPRKRPGRVLPPSKSMELQGKITNYLKQQYEESSLADAAKLLEGFNPAEQIKQLGTTLTGTRIQQLEKDLAAKQAEWNKAIAALPSSQDLTNIQNRVNAISTGGISNPAEALNRVNSVQQVLSESNARMEQVKSTAGNLTNDTDAFGKSIGELDQLVKQDVNTLEKSIQLPSLNAKDLGKQLFGRSIADKVATGQRYVGLARQYMPPKKKEEPLLVPPRRRAGVNYEFGRPHAYPRFWLRNAPLSSRGENSLFGGNLQGRLTDLTTNPPLVGRPMILDLQGDFPKLNVLGANIHALFDHTGDTAINKITARVGSYPLADQVLSDSGSLKFAIAKAVASAGMQATITGNRFSIGIDNVFNQVDYLVTTQSKTLESTLKSALKDIPSISMKAQLEGTFDDFSLSVDSNLATALSQALAKQLQAKVAEARQRIEALVQQNIGQKKSELTGKFNETKTKVTSEVEARRKQVDAIRSQADQKITQIKSQATNVQKQLGDQFKKRLGF